MNVLGIETSCDETAISLIDASGTEADFSYEVLGNALLSQAALHAQYGGVFPNLAKREHAKNLVPLLEQTLREATLLQPSAGPALGAALVPLKQLLEREAELFSAIVPFLLKFEKPAIDCIAVTTGPGLEPALWVGINFAKALSIVWDIPLVAVNHMEGHIIMSLVTESGMNKFDYPVLALLISGGHTELVLSKQFGEYQRIGETRDDAAGEAFDKVARLLELGYPGGPEISKLAAEARANNIKGDFSFTRPMLHEDNYDFSFSGLKTAVRNLTKQREMTDELKLQIAREFEECVADVLITKTLRAAEEFGAQTVVVGGGVSANTFIREQLGSRLAATGCTLLAPPPTLATDNALMIALAGYFHAQKKELADIGELRAQGSLTLGRS